MPWIGPAIGAAGSIAGGLLSNEDTVRVMDGIPDFLKNDYKNLMGGIGGLQAPEYFQGNTVAGLNDYQNQGLQGLAGYGQGQGGMINAGQFMSGMGGVNAFGGGMNFLNNYANQGANQYQFDQGAFDQTMGNLMPGMQANFDQGALDIQKGFDRGFMPQLDMSAINSGQQGGTAHGKLSALGQSEADSNKYNFGLDLLTNAQNQAMNVGHSSGMANLQTANQFGTDMMRGYGNMAQMGLGQLQSAYGTGEQNLQNMMGVGEYYRGFDQQNIDADRERWDYNQNLGMNHLNNQLSMMMGNMPNSPNAGMTYGMSPGEGAMQGAQFGMGLYGAGQEAGWWGQGNSGGGWDGSIDGLGDLDWG